MKKRNLKLVSPILMWLIVAFGVAFIFLVSSSEKMFQRSYLGIALSSLFFAYWVFFFFWSIKYHKKAPLSTFKIEKLVKEGPYEKIRHPLYSADIVFGIGIFLLFPIFKIFFSLLWFAFVLVFWARLEEKSLINKFGKNYKDYMEKTPMFIPYLKFKIEK